MAITFSGKAKKTEEAKTGQPQAPAKKKFGGLKFAVSTAAIKKMAVKTLVAGGLVIPATQVPGPAPEMPAPARPAPRGLSGRFNDAARDATPLEAAARNNNASMLEALIRNGADIFARRPAAMPARPRMPSPSPA